MPHFRVQAVRELHYEAEVSARNQTDAENILRDKIRDKKLYPLTDIIVDFEVEKISS